MDRSQEDSQLRMRDGYDQMLQKLLHTMAFTAIVLALLVVPTFGSFSRPPQSLSNTHAGNSIDSSIWRKLFIYFNGASFFSAVCGLLLSVCSGMSPLALPIPPVVGDLEKETAIKRKRVAETLPKFFYTSMLLILSISFFAAAYVCAGELATVRERTSEQVAVMVSCVLGGVVLIQVLGICVRDMLKLWREICESHAELWHALKRETLFGYVLTNYMEKF